MHTEKHSEQTDKSNGPDQSSPDAMQGRTSNMEIDMHENSEKRRVNRDAADMVFEKYEVIINGLRVQQLRENPDRTAERVCYFSLTQLALITASLTSSDKNQRARAKEQLRELVKLGREAAE